MNYYEEIREQLVNNEINKKVKDYTKNKTELQTYYNVGKLLIEAQGGETRAKYGNKLIKEYSIRLTKELGKGYSITTLKYMRKYYLYQKGQQIVDLLPWGHFTILLSINNSNKLEYYKNICIKYNLSRNELVSRIKSNEYERLPEKTKEKLINNNKDYKVSEFIQNPILVSNPNNIDIESIKEKVLQKLIIEDIENIMKQLGEGFSYIDKEYKIKLGNNYNYIDLLLFNYIYNSFIVLELKVTNLKKEHIGQIQTYMNYVDKNVKKDYHNKTIGIIIVKKDDKYILEYSSDKRIYSTSFILI